MRIAKILMIVGIAVVVLVIGAAVVLMSILQTCVEQGVNAVEYLRDVLVRVNEPGSAKEIAELTPMAWKRSQAAKERVARNRVAIAKAVEGLIYRDATAGS